MKNLFFLLFAVTLVMATGCQKDDLYDEAYGRSTNTNNNGNNTPWSPNPETIIFIGSSYTGVSTIYSYQYKISINNSLVNPDLDGDGDIVEHLYVARVVSGQIAYYNQTGQAEYQLSQSGAYIYVTIISENSHVSWNLSVGDASSPRWFLAYGSSCKYTQETGQPNSYDDGARNYYNFNLLGGNWSW